MHNALILGLKPGLSRDKIKFFIRRLMAILGSTQPCCLDLKYLVGLSDSVTSISIMQLLLMCLRLMIENQSSLSLKGR